MFITLGIIALGLVIAALIVLWPRIVYLGAPNADHWIGRHHSRFIPQFVVQVHSVGSGDHLSIAYHPGSYGLEVARVCFDGDYIILSPWSSLGGLVRLLLR